MKIAVALIFLMTLTACGRSPINVVKNSYVDEGRTTTASQLLENRALCQDIRWKNFTDDRRRNVVEYICTFKKSHDFLKTKREEYIKTKLSSLQGLIESSEKSIAYNDGKLKAINEFDIKVWEETEMAKIAEMKPQSTARLDILKTTEIQVSQLIQDSNEEALARFFMDGDFEKFRRTDIRSALYPISELTNRAAVLKIQSRYMLQGRRTEADRMQYKAQNVIPHLEFLRSRLPIIKQHIFASIENENQRIAEQHQASILRMTQDIEERKKDIETNKAQLLQRNEELKKSIEKLQTELSGVKNSAASAYPVYKGLEEKFQWIVNREGEPSLQHGEILALGESAEKNKILVKHIHPNNTFALIARTESDDHQKYLASTAVTNFLNLLAQ